MFGTLGFSYMGCIYLMLLTIPNLIWAKHQPTGYTAEHENRLLLTLERSGQVLTTIVVLIFTDFNYHTAGIWNLWLYVSFFLMFLYECYWIRYFRNPTLHTFYSPFLKIPAPGATLPIVAFFLLGVYGKVLWLMIAVTILGIGHIGIHLQHIKTLQKN